MNGTFANAQAGAGLVEANAQTQASMAYALMRKDIIKLALPPASKLRIRDLCERYGFAMSSIREALNRLTQDGLVRLVDQRGFTVCPMSLQDLEELTKARRWLTECAVRESIRLGDAKWEEAVLLAYHRMSRTPRYATPDAVDVSPEWDAAHRVFHASLISACGSSWILNFSEQLFDAADRYRYLSRSAQRKRPDDDHRDICDAVLARDVDVAVRLSMEHLQHTAALGAIAIAQAVEQKPFLPRAVAKVAPSELQ